MKLVRMFGIAMVAAVAAMAIIGAGTASATLCKKNESPCAAANQYPVPTTIKAIGTAVTFSGTITVTCDSDITLVHEGEKGGKLFGKLTSIVWLNCKGCSPVLTTLLPSFEDEATSGGNGKLTFLTMKVEQKSCLGIFTCQAEARNSNLTFTGGAIGTASATATNVPVMLAGVGCGTSGTWSARYVITEVNGSKTGSIFQE